ncbi:hypothetical protein N308_11390, partial [Struthio camelus australis]
GGANTPHKLWTAALDGESQTSHSDLTPSPTAMHGSVNPVTIVESPHSEIQAAKESVLQRPTFAPSGKTLEQNAMKKTSSPTTSTRTSQSDGHSDSDPDKDKIESSSSSNGTSLQSESRKVPLLQEVNKIQHSATGNRSLKQSAHSTDITSTQQDASFKASGLETT